MATTTGTAVALAVWRRGHRLRTPLVGIVAGLLNRPWGRARRATTLPLLRSMHAMLYGPGEAPGLLALDPGLAERVHLNPFGVDTRFWAPADADGPGAGVLAIGNDGHRDWATLLRAAPKIDAEVRILTMHRRPPSLPDNVRWEPADWHRRVLTDADVRSAFRSAAVVVVPVKDVPQPSGQSVTLQASACARPVVLSRTRGLWDPEALRDGENVLLVPPGDPDAIACGRARACSPTRRSRPASDARLGRPSRRRRTSSPTRSGCSGSASSHALVPDRGLPLRAGNACNTLLQARFRRLPYGGCRSGPKPRAALVHARDVAAPGWLAPPHRARRRAFRRDGRADLALFHEFAPPPSGGGHQFLRALAGELARRGLAVEENRISGGDARVPLQLVQLRLPRACAGSPATTCGWCIASTARSACTAASTTAPTPGSPR